MCNPACVDFAKTNLTLAQVRGKFVLEVGSLSVNGSVRQFVETLEPGKYIGVDIVGARAWIWFAAPMNCSSVLENRVLIC